MGAEHVFHRSTLRPPIAVRGEGIHLIDDNGRRYIDACGGAAVSCLGHGHPKVAAAIARQASDLEYVHTGFFTSNAAEELAAMVAGMCPGSLDRVWYTSSGSEAIEAALKLARPYHLERGDHGRRRRRQRCRRNQHHSPERVRAEDVRGAREELRCGGGRMRRDHRVRRVRGRP